MRSFTSITGWLLLALLSGCGNVSSNLQPPGMGIIGWPWSGELDAFPGQPDVELRVCLWCASFAGEHLVRVRDERELEGIRWLELEILETPPNSAFPPEPGTDDGSLPILQVGWYPAGDSSEAIHPLRLFLGETPP